jgi:hypothetical protein
MERMKAWWIGVRASDIHGIEGLFKGGIAVVGTFEYDSFRGISLEKKIGRRLNHNSLMNNACLNEAILNAIRLIKRDTPDAKFFYQDQLCFSQSTEFFHDSVYNNPPGLIGPLKNKGTARALLGRHLPSVGSTTVFAAELSYDALCRLFPGTKRFVVQVPDSSGGHGTVLIQTPDDVTQVEKLGAVCLVVSEFRDKAVPMNSHVIVFHDRAIVLPPSAQLVEPDEGGRLLYIGCDYLFPSSLAGSVRTRITEACTVIGEILRQNGYRGVVGIDYLLDGDEFIFVEINPRFQASTAAMNQTLLQRNLPSVHQMHMDAFEGRRAPDLPADAAPEAAFVHLIKRSSSFDLQTGERCLRSPDNRDTPFSQEQVGLHVDLEGGISDVPVDDGAILGRVCIDRPVLYQHPTMGPLSNHALTKIGRRPPRLIDGALRGEIEPLARLKFSLFSHGALLTSAAKVSLDTVRADLTIRDGIAGGLEVRLPHRVHVNIPIKEHFALLSPYAIDVDGTGSGFCLIDPNGDAMAIDILPLPDFVTKKTSCGTPMVDVGQMFNERLALEIYYGCINNSRKNTACQFCELGAETNQSFTHTSDIRELVAYCEASSSIPMRHVLIGGGTPPEQEWPRYFEALEAVRAETTVPTYMMIAPPNDLRRLDELHARGLNEIGMNIELFDRDLARRFMPAKGKLSLARYFGALERAVKLWGNKGAVRSILIVGLEPLESTLAGVDALCRRGVMPILSPYRPVPSTALAHCPPPSPDMMYQAWMRGQDIAAQHNQVLGPTCIACQNNTIAMPFGNQYRYY